MSYQALHNKEFAITIRNGLNDSLSSFQKFASLGEFAFTTDTHRLFISNDTAGSGNATLTEVATIDSLTNATGTTTALTQAWNGKKQNIDPTSNAVLFTVASGVIEKGFESRFIITTSAANNFSISGASGVSINGVDNTVVNYDNTYQNKYIDVEATADNTLVVQVLETVPTPAIAASDLTSFDFAGNPVFGANSASVTYTGNFTFQSGNGGKNHIINSATDVTGTMPSGFQSGIGFPVLVIGSGAFVPSTGAGTAINNRQSHTKTAGIYAVASLISYSADNYLFIGDTAV